MVDEEVIVPPFSRTREQIIVRYRSMRVFSVTVTCDLVAWFFAIMILVLAHGFNPANGKPLSPVGATVMLFAFIPVFAAFGLYKGLTADPITELRRLVLSITLLYGTGSALFVLLGKTPLHAWAWFLSWLVAITVTPLARSIARGALCRRDWWGIPAAIFYTGSESVRLVEHLRRHPECGVMPVAMLAPGATEELHASLPIFHFNEAGALRNAGVSRAIIALSESGETVALEALEQFENIFPHLLIMQGASAIYSRGVSACEIGRSLAVEVRRRSLSLSSRFCKRTAELALLIVTAPFVFLVVAVAAILVKLDSPGPIFFGHNRVGRNNETFRAWKLRTMHVNGPEILEKLFAESPEAREEWARDRKLRNDPRVTRLGRFLRRSSLDEVPQLWNVLRGEMSLVGPRPIVAEEAALYGRHFPLYCRVTPGMTGLWQVSGRSKVAVSERVQLDSYYVRNWSIWLDLHILMRTARTILIGEGAY